MNFVEKLAAANDLAALEAEVAKRENYKIRRYFPETGPLSRHKYVRAMEFFAAGNHYPERLILGGNRCITPWTPIETVGGERLIAEMIGVGGFDIRAWDGSSRCNKRAGGVFLKSIEPAFLIHLDNGQYFAATSRHQVLTTEGWTSVERLIRASSGLHCWRTPSDSPANYATDGRRDDALLQLVLAGVPAPPPPRADVLAHDRCSNWLAGAEVRRFLCSQTSRPFDRPAILDDPRLLADLCARFPSDPLGSLDAVWPTRLRRELRQWLLAYSPPSQTPPPQRGQPWDLDALDSTTRASDSRLSDSILLPVTGVQGVASACPDLGWLGLSLGAPGEILFVPSSYSPFLVGGQRIVGVVKLDYQPILDFTVEDVNCYGAGGVIHHNTGKTESAAFETSVHLTGEYPDWWPGRRFTHPILAWAAGDTATTTRDIQQLSLYGPIPAAPKSGLIPAHHIRHVATKNSVAGGLETIFVRHKSGGDSQIQFRSFDQRREAFQGTERHLIWLDEEPPEDVYTEALMRTLTCQGIMMVTFTPVEGLTPFVQNWIEQAVIIHVNTNERTGEQTEVVEAADAVIFQGLDDAPDAELVEVDAKGKVIAAEPRPALTVDQSMLKQVVPIAERTKRIIMVSWTDVPHLSPEACAQMLSSIPPYQRNARLKGIPNLGSGVIYPIPEEEIRVDPFDIPAHWPRGYGMDVGWNWTAATHCAYDTSSDIWYLYRTYKRSGAEPPVHAAGIKAAGEWIPGVIDPAANSRGQKDGVRLMSMYRQLGLHLEFAQNDVATGLDMIWMLLSSGRLKVFSHLKDFFTEYRMYRRNIKGEVVKKDDHLCDSLRYRILSGTGSLQVAPVASGGRVVRDYGGGSGNYGWMG